jgi:DNA-binding transcriptional LysR family regulator
MTLDQLRVFVAVADRGHVTRASEELGLTQSAVSAALAALERSRGLRLFQRVGRGIALSEEGRVFLPEARGVLDRAAAADAVLDDLAGLRRGRVLIFASQTISTYWLPERLARFSAAHPAVELNVRVGNSAQVVEGVLAGTAEIGFVEGRSAEAGLERRVVGGDRLALAAAADHPLVMGPGASVNDLFAADWVLREPGSGTRAEFEAALRALGRDPLALRAPLVLTSNEAILGACASSRLLCAVSELAAEPFLAAGRIRLLPFAFPERAFDLLARRGWTPSRAARAFLDALAVS